MRGTRARARCGKGCLRANSTLAAMGRQARPGSSTRWFKDRRRASASLPARSRCRRDPSRHYPTALPPQARAWICGPAGLRAHDRIRRCASLRPASALATSERSAVIGAGRVLLQERDRQVASIADAVLVAIGIVGGDRSRTTKALADEPRRCDHALCADARGQRSCGPHGCHVYESERSTVKGSWWTDALR